MFTGLIETVGKVTRLEMNGAAAVLTVAGAFPDDEIAVGDSIAVNGVCLTVTGFGGGTFSFDVSPETVRRTAFREFRNGTSVNLERALRVSGRLDGHLVSGHADCVATITERRPESGNTLLAFAMPKEYLKYVAEKGSIAIDGISLTVNTVGADGFSVNIIPHTLAKTALKDKKAGDTVNIETDILAKYVERILTFGKKGQDAGISWDLLAKSGFM